MQLKYHFKKNPFIYFFIRSIRKIEDFLVHTVAFNIEKKIRVLGIYTDPKYLKIKQYKNTHLGERCFIVATGPSLTIEDLEKLKNEVTISMNSIVLLNKDKIYKPTYYGIQDIYVYDKIKEKIFEESYEHLFVADRIAKKRIIPTNSTVFPLNLLNHDYIHNNYWTKFSDDCYKEVYDGYTITYSLIQIAAYMGFKEIFLLGADTNYNKEKQHFIEHGVRDNSFEQAGIRMIEAYKIAKEYADMHNIRIYNATRGGMLEVFPRVDLDEVLGLTKS